MKGVLNGLINRCEGVNGNILVPLRPLSEFFSARVQWDEGQKAIHIHTNRQVNPI
ncbi:MAG: stalk domain-containing protein [Bacillota bacterium]